MLALAALSFVVGGVIKGMSGFGLPLVVISLNSTFMPIEAALAINIIPPFVLNLWQTGGKRAIAQTWRDYSPVLIALPIGIAVGALSASALHSNWLVGAVGLVTVAFCLTQFAGWKLHLSPRRVATAGWGTGFMTGFLGSLTTVTGPPLVMYLLAARATPFAFKSALGLFFVVVGIALAGAFASIGFLTVELALIGGLMTLPAALGMWFGGRLSKRIDAEIFRYVVLVLLLVLGVNLLFRASFN